ncbi:hypothetical protein CWR48_06885 [Oceanobacillus arenosus]|uniref:Carboxypeptidase regulatory-like domain-containing protein n=1 Tax=Oceanobacillus arenosus TaxID=1229153 RepID=A0A3D8PV73_9BACI|nr:hypothetical protein [Oceanobacillus arenosus]RDW20026.1 hypothetical protein CWR48_06885 [Oceanobacillus arenosus]
MVKKLLFIFFMSMLLLLAACKETSNDQIENVDKQEVGQKDSKEEQGEKSVVQDVSLSLDKQNLSVTPWQYDHSQLEEVKGVLTADGKPVSDAEIQVDGKRVIKTDETGSFNFMIDRNNLANKIVQVVNVEDAKIGESELSDETKHALLSLSENITVNYPIEISSVKPSKEKEDLVVVEGKAILDENQEYPAFGTSKYSVHGTIVDSEGDPIEGATVNLRRDGVEGFTVSPPSNEYGEYQMMYLPEDDEDHYLNVVYEGTTYHLPDNKVFQFPEDISVQVDIQLPNEGEVITDEPPYLVSKTAPGALYTGIMIGLHVDKGVEYSVTIPNRDGTFIMEVPKSVWDESPTFYQATFESFLLEGKESGDMVSSGFLPEPNEDEPTLIIPSEG